MLTKVLDWVVGREPVATATGFAGVITALLGVVAAAGVDMDPELIAAVGVLVTAVAGWLARRAVSPVTTPALREAERRDFLLATGDTVEGDSRIDPERGGPILSMVIVIGAIALAIAFFFVACDALFEDEDEKNDLGHGRIELVSHEYDYEYDERERCYDDDYCEGGDNTGQEYGDQRNHNRRNRGAFSPGPFDDSPVDAFNGNVVCLPGSTCYSDERNRQGEGEPRE